MMRTRVVAVVAVALLSLLAVVPIVLAEGTPTPLPVRVYLPLIFSEYRPPAPQTVVFQHGNGGYTGATDTYISSYGNPYAPHGFEPILALRWEKSQIADAEASLLSFNLSSIPVGATVQDARLRFYVTGRTNMNPMTMAAYEVYRPWVAAYANWYSATLTTAWAAPGCNGINSDRAGLPLDSVGVTNTGLWAELSVKDAVQAWVRNPGGNLGLTLKPIGDGSTPSVRYELAGALHPDPGLRPLLEVTYIVLPAPPPTVVPETATRTPTPTQTSSAPSSTSTATRTPTATWTPAPSWWNVNYSFRRRLDVQTALSSGVEAGYVVSLTLDTAQFVTQGKLRADRADWRIVAWNGWTWAEIPRDLAAPAETWFALARAIAGGGSNSLYYVYYGNADAMDPPLSDRRQIYTLYDDFDDYEAAIWPWPPPSGVVVASGFVTVTAFDATGGIADSCPGAYDCLLSRQAFPVGYQVEHRARHPDYVYNKRHDADQGFSDDGHSNEAKMRSYNTAQFQRVNRDGATSVVVQCCQPADTLWHVFRVARLPDRILFQVDGGPVDVSTTHLPLLPLPVHIRAFSAEPWELSRNVVDWVKVRPIVAVEPVVVWGPEEQATFILP